MTTVRADCVVTGDAVLRPGWVTYEDGQVSRVGSGRPPAVDRDFGDVIIVPGFVDLHVHGGGGGSFSVGEPASTRLAVMTHRRHGTTTTLASLVTADPGDLVLSVSQLADLCDDGLIAGIHLEGPFLSERRAGAHDRRLLRDPDPAEIDRLLEAARGSLAMVTLAPEREGGLRAIRQLVAAGVTVAIGHTDATYDLVNRAIAAGASVGTHVFNAMRPLHHREPGPILALLEDPRVTIELVADRVHLHPAVYRHVVETTAAERVVLVTDAMAAAALGDGEHRLGPVDVTVTDGIARVSGSDTIAGGTATMDVLFRHAVADGEPGTAASRPSDSALIRAVRQTATNPARTLARHDIGSLQPGRRADMVILDAELEVVRVQLAESA